MPAALTALILLSFSGVQAQPETSYIIVHAHNPEGVEIASIEGMSQRSVEIYDGDTLIGYGAHDASSHNQPITISSGNHAIKVKFNGITLERQINIGSNETQILTFTFKRSVWDFRGYLDNIGTITRSGSGSLSHPPSPPDSWNIFAIDNNTDYPRIEQWVAMHIFVDYRRDISVTTTGHVEMSISSSGISHRVWADTLASSSVAGYLAYTVSLNASWYWWFTGVVPRYIDLIPALQTAAFNNWFLQNKAIPELILPTYRCYLNLSGVGEIVDSNSYSIRTFEAVANREAYIWSYSPCFYADWYGRTIYQEFVPSNFYLSEVYCSSVPYDLTGTGIKYEGFFPPDALFTYSPKESYVSEQIIFDASSSNDPDGAIVKYEWDFGDGTTAEGVQVVHAYAKEGEYTVTLTVTDNDGLTGYAELRLNIGPTFEILDGADFSAGREISSDTERLVSTKGVPVEGAVTDGVTRLLLKVHTDTPDIVTFSLEGTGNPNEDGLLRSLDGSQQGSSITVITVNTSDGEKAFAIYQAPENFVRQGYSEDRQTSERKILLKVKPVRLPTSELSEEIKLLRPPLILIHGLWSGPEMWNGFSASLRNKLPGIRTFVANYRPTNASSFDINKEKVFTYISEARGQLLSEGIAMVQADVLGHSMGGILGRIRAENDIWAESEEYIYKQNKNFLKGDINKLITLDSPHFGSFLADFSIGFINILPATTKIVFLEYARYKKHPFDDGAINDLMTNSIPIMNLNSVLTDPASHSIVGDFVVDVDLSLVPGEIGTIYGILKNFGFNTAVDIIPGQSDLVVSGRSQAGGLFPPSSSTFNHNHCAATTEEVVNKTIELLDTAPDASSFATGFPVNKWSEF